METEPRPTIERPQDQELAALMIEVATKFRRVFPTADNFVIEGIFNDSTVTGSIQTTDQEGIARVALLKETPLTEV